MHAQKHQASNFLLSCVLAAVGIGLCFFCRSETETVRILFAGPQQRPNDAATYCKQQNHPTPPGAKAFQMTTLRGNATMYMLNGSDYVSDHIGEGFEHAITESILKVLQNTETTDPLFVDIGANLGLHAVPVAAAGFRTLAFEGAPTNQAMLKATLCANQPLLDKMTLVTTALGTNARNCAVWAWKENMGNGMMHCDGRAPAADWVRLGDASVRRLDDIVTDAIEVVKMDVEGFEGHVLGGASKLLMAEKIKWIFFEYTPHAFTLHGGDPAALAINLMAYGFECSSGLDTSKHPSNWTYMTAKDLLHWAYQGNILINLVCRKRRRVMAFAEVA